MSVNSTSPSTLFGGTWQQIQNRFLFSAGGSYGVNNTGGSYNETLNANQIPSHTHHIPALGGYTSQDGNHAHNINYTNDATYGTGKSGHRIATGNNSIGSSGVPIQAGGIHGHVIATYENNTGTAGGNQAHNNMPPYLVVYMWKRVS